MTCAEARESFSDLYDGHLSGPPLAELDRHLEGCSACRAEWDDFLKAIQAVAELGAAEPSPGFAARVRGRIEAPTWWQRAVRAAFFPLQVKIPIQAVAVALVAFTAVLLFQKSPEMQREAPFARTPPAVSSAPAAGAKAAAPPTAPRALEEAADEGRDPKLQADALRSRVAPERQVSPGEGATLPAKPAPTQEKDRDRADKMERTLDDAKPPADQSVAPAGPPEPPPASLAQPAAPPPAAPAAPAPVPRPPSAFRDEAKELGKVPVPAETESSAEPSAGMRAKRADQEGSDVRARRAGPAEPTPGRAIAPAHPPLAPPGLAAPAPPPSPPATAGDDLYSAAITEYARRDYDRAIESFRAFLAQHPRDPRVPDARFRLGDAYFAQQRYAEAIPQFEAVVQQHPGSPHVRPALFRQGLARLAVGDPAGCQILRDAVSRYPQATEAAQAREALGARCR